MFILTTVCDRIRIPAHALSMPTLEALHNEIDVRYPNRVLMNIGLVVCRYGDCLKITNGLCVSGDGGSHHECLFRLVVFRPFVEEVCLGTVVRASPEGIQVSLGNFYHDIFVPAYWMLRPSKYNEKLGLWVWSPDYGNEEDEENGETTKDAEGGGENGAAAVKMEDGVKKEGGDEDAENKEDDGENENNGENDDDDGDHFEMDIGAEIRFKIKSIHFTQVMNTAKGVQATTTTTAHSREIPAGSKDEPLDAKSSAVDGNKRRRARTLSAEVIDPSRLPASMQIVASICEDGLGLTSWWTNGDDEEEEEGEEEEGGEEEGGGAEIEDV